MDYISTMFSCPLHNTYHIHEQADPILLMEQAFSSLNNRHILLVHISDSGEASQAAVLSYLLFDFELLSCSSEMMLGRKKILHFQIGYHIQNRM